MKKLSIIIPVYNEDKTFLQLLERVEKARLPDGVEREIIVVDDVSTDGTSAILAQASTRFRLIVNGKNSGKGFSVKRGLEASQGDFVIIQDADLEYDTADYERLIAPLLNGEADVVYGSRFLGKTRPESMALKNWLANKVLTYWSNLFTGLSITDMETCYKMFSREVVRKITPSLTSERFGIEPELTSLVKKYRVLEIPINYKGRSAVEGKKIGWADGLSSLYEIVKFNLPPIFRKIDWEASIVIALVFSSVLVFLPPQLSPDSHSIWEAKEVLWGEKFVVGFVPNRILTSPLGLFILGLSGKISSNILVSWVVLNGLFFAAASYFLYRFCYEVFGKKKFAILSLILFSTNYAVITFGLGFLMDAGGWAGFFGAIYFAQKYYRTSSLVHLGVASAFVAIGGLIKEYAFFASIFIACTLVYKYLIHGEREWKKFFTHAMFSGLIATLPVVVVYAIVYWHFGYTYLDWFAFNEVKYPRSGLFEYVKVFGSLYTFGWLLLLISLVRIKREDFKALLPLVFVFISTLPLLLWPVTTQRIQFLVLAAPIALSGLVAREMRRYWPVITILVVLYVLCSYNMDSYVLPHVNIDALFN